MSKKEADKARMATLKTIKRRLKSKHRVAEIAAETGYTSARIYQIWAQMAQAGEIAPAKRRGG